MLDPIRLLKKYDLYNCKPDISSLAKKLNVSIFLQEYEKEAPDLVNQIDPYLRGYIYINKSDRIESNHRIISIDKIQCFEFKRFTIAYLLSAYLLKGNDNNYYLSCVGDNYDYEILNYCKDLLVSNELLEQEIMRLGIDNYDEIQEQFAVPDFILREKVKTYRRKYNEII